MFELSSSVPKGGLEFLQLLACNIKSVAEGFKQHYEEFEGYDSIF